MTTSNVAKNHLTLHSLKGVKPSAFFPVRTDMTASHCAICGKSLTKADSIMHMIGPDCRKKYVTNGFYQIPVSDQPSALQSFWGYLAPANLDKDLNDYLLANEKDFSMLADILIAYCSIVTKQDDGHSKIVIVASALRAIGYDTVADRLEEDRCKILVYPQHSATHIKVVVPTAKKQFDSVKVEFDKYLGSKAYTLVKPNRTNRGAYFEISNTKTMETLYALGKDFSGERFFTKGQPKIGIIDDRQFYGLPISPCAEFLANVSPLIFIEQNNDRVTIKTVGNPWHDTRIKGMQTWAKQVQGFKWASGYVLTVPHTAMQSASAKAISLGYETWEISEKVVTPYTAPQPVAQPVNKTPKATVSPTRVGSDWGVWSNTKLAVGDYVTVSTKSGKSWLAVVTKTTNHSKKYLTKSA